MATYVINRSGSPVTTFPPTLAVGDVLKFNSTGTGPDGTLLVWNTPYDMEVQITAVGAGGKSIMNYQGGRPAKMVGDFSLQKGREIAILVGQVGSNTSLGYTGGGGASGVWQSGKAFIIAGGGGGCNGGYPEDSPSDWYHGMNASISTAGNPGSTIGEGGASQQPVYVMSGAGWNSDGVTVIGSNITRAPQALKFGGLGGKSGWSNGGFGGGGGGLYAGGGGGYSGGNAGGHNLAAGGGGSYNAGTNQSNQIYTVYNTNGFVEIRILKIDAGLSLYPRINGAVREYDKGWVKINGQLREIDKMWTKINGVLKEV